MAINTPLGDTLDGFLAGLLAGRSAITQWRAFDTSRIYSKVGGDLSGYDVNGKLGRLKETLDPAVYKRLRKLVPHSPWSTQLSMLAAADAWHDAGFAGADLPPGNIGVIVAGHNLNSLYADRNRDEFDAEPDYIDAMFALRSLDTDHAGSVSDVLQAKGPIFTVGGACASGNTALRCAVDEVRHHGLDAVFVVGAALEFAPMDVHAMALMGAITFNSFNDAPELASRPYDTRREGFVPSHGTAVLVVENADTALARGARVYAEVLAVEATSDGNHLPQPSEDGQAAAMQRVLDSAGIRPEEVDYVNAHATSTPLGDLSELRAIKRVFGAHARNLVLNATKSMLGHTCWAAPTVESVAAILQMNAGRLHPSINIDTLDPEVDLDVCREARTKDIRLIMKNSFGFGGINCVSLLKRWDG
jgi:3-oxoacyl-(acyl-carrier-protein) synthase